MAICSLVALLLISVCIVHTNADSPACGDWEAFKDDHCYKIIDKSTLYTYADAEKECKDNGSTLIQIKNKEEQEFLTSFLFGTNKVVDNVWIGAKYENSSYKWDTDQSELAFTNWEQGYPKSNEVGHCAMVSSDEGSVGKWIDGSCLKKALAICQKGQTLSLEQLHKMLLNLKQSFLPINFIYVQLPHEPQPSELWSWMVWQDVSETYGGLFFRVAGGSAGAFGKIQEESDHRLSSIENAAGPNHAQKTDVAPGNWSLNVFTGAKGDGELLGLQFMVAPDEVRPRNMAMKVWKRTA